MPSLGPNKAPTLALLAKPENESSRENSKGVGCVFEKGGTMKFEVGRWCCWPYMTIYENM